MRRYKSTNGWSFGVAGIPLGIAGNAPTLPDMLDLTQRAPIFAMADGGVRKGTMSLSAA